ncbi:MAG: hypothetical protein AAF307_12670 [Pseudomonadota bacterium]
MKRLAPLILCAALIPLAAHADEAEGQSLMERGMQLFFEGLMQEMEPAIEEFQGLTEDIGPSLRQFADQMGPKLSALMAEIEDWSVYEPPEILPNGDIIIRRKPDAPAPVPETPAPQIDL